MNEQLARMTLDWSEERFDEEGELLTRSNMAMISSVSYTHLDVYKRQDWDKIVETLIDFLKNGAGNMLNSTLTAAKSIISGEMCIRDRNISMERQKNFRNQV